MFFGGNLKLKGIVVIWLGDAWLVSYREVREVNWLVIDYKVSYRWLRLEKNS